MSTTEERRPGLGRLLHEVLAQSVPLESPLIGGREPDTAVVDALLELLRQRFPGDVVAVRCEVGPDLAVTRVGVADIDHDAAYELSSAIEQVLVVGEPCLFEIGDGQVYATPRGLDGAVAVRRPRGVLSGADHRFVDLVARFVR
jgi:hypothetical protein